MTAPVDLPPPAETAPFVLSAAEMRPVTERERVLCERASSYDWLYMGAFTIGFLSTMYLNNAELKHAESVPWRLAGPGLVGFAWGGLLSGGHLSFASCTPHWISSPPAEGNAKAIWPLAIATAATAAVTAPLIEFTFVGPMKPYWSTGERSSRIFIAGGSAVLGTLFPYLVPPRTWAAAKELEKIRIEQLPGGAQISYGTAFF